jgi:cytochrome b561
MMAPAHTFKGVSRLLHWVMAAMILAMMFIGIGMVTSHDLYATLVDIHRPLGIAVLILAAVRLINRQFNPAPALPAAMPPLIKFSAQASHVALYVLMFAVPLVGWSMLSAGAYPVEMFGAFHLPPIMPHDQELYAVLRRTHTVLAVLFFLVFLAHLGAALAHALIFRDGVFESMASVGRSTSRPLNE